MKYGDLRNVDSVNDIKEFNPGMGQEFKTDLRKMEEAEKQIVAQYIEEGYISMNDVKRIFASV